MYLRLFYQDGASFFSNLCNVLAVCFDSIATPIGGELSSPWLGKLDLLTDSPSTINTVKLTMNDDTTCRS
jgi:hypothetical protein